MSGWEKIYIMPLLLACLASCSTKGLFRDIAKQEGRISNQTEVISQGNRSQVKMTWNSALERLLKENTSLKQSYRQLEEVRRQRKNQWRELLPRPSFYVNVQKSLRELDAISSDDISSSLIAPLNIPNPLTVQARTYQYALQELQAEANNELTKRRFIIELYRLFMQWGRQVDRDAQTPVAASLEDEVKQRMSGYESAMQNSETKQLMFAQFSRVLNLPGVDVTPILSSLPKTDYSGELPRLVPGRNYGRLATQLAAYAIEGAILQKRGIKLRELPTTNFNTTTPALYDSHREGGPDTEYISLYSGMSKSFDLTGQEAAQIKSAKDNVRVVKENLRLRLDNEGRQWTRLKRRYVTVTQRKQLLEARLRGILQRKGETLASQDLQNVRSIQNDLKSTARSKEDMDLEVWLWDDKRWGYQR